MTLCIFEPKSCLPAFSQVHFFNAIFPMRTLFFFCALVLTAHVSGQTATRDTFATINSDWHTYSRDAWSVHFPDSFTLDTSRTLGITFFLFSRPAHASDQFRENINLYVQELNDPSMDLDKYARASEEQISKLINQVVMIESRKVTDSALPYYRLSYTGEQGQFTFKWVQHIYYQSGKIYLLTFTTEISTFEHYAAIGNSILQSFSLR